MFFFSFILKKESYRALYALADPIIKANYVIIHFRDLVFDDENYSLYFTKPEQLLDIFTEMEEKSLPLVQKSQYASETLDKIHSTINRTRTEQNHQVEQLQIKINQLEELIKHEIEREISCQNILMYFSVTKIIIINQLFSF